MIYECMYVKISGTSSRFLKYSYRYYIVIYVDTCTYIITTPIFPKRVGNSQETQRYIDVAILGNSFLLGYLDLYALFGEISAIP